MEYEKEYYSVESRGKVGRAELGDQARNRLTVAVAHLTQSFKKKKS